MRRVEISDPERVNSSPPHPSIRSSQSDRRESNAAGRVMLPLPDFPPTSFDKQSVAGSSFILIWPQINDLMRVMVHYC